MYPLFLGNSSAASIPFKLVMRQESVCANNPKDIRIFFLIRPAFNRVRT